MKSTYLTLQIVSNCDEYLSTESYNGCVITYTDILCIFYQQKNDLSFNYACKYFALY